MPSFSEEMKDVFTLHMSMDVVRGTIMGPAQVYYPANVRVLFAMNRLFVVLVGLAGFFFPLMACVNSHKIRMADAQSLLLIPGGLVLGGVMLLELWKSPKRWAGFREKRAKCRRPRTRFELRRDRLHIDDQQWTWDELGAIQYSEDIPGRCWVRPRQGEAHCILSDWAGDEHMPSLAELMESWRVRFGTAHSLPPELHEIRGQGQDGP